MPNEEPNNDLPETPAEEPKVDETDKASDEESKDDNAKKAEESEEEPKADDAEKAEDLPEEPEVAEAKSEAANMCAVLVEFNEGAAPKREKQDFLTRRLAQALRAALMQLRMTGDTLKSAGIQDLTKLSMLIAKTVTDQMHHDDEILTILDEEEINAAFTFLGLT